MASTAVLAQEQKYVQFTSELKNLYGKIEISDKAMRASANSAGAFVNLLNAEMEGLIKASSFNFGRMLYGDGSGLLATVASFDSTTGVVTLDSVRNLIEGMIIDIYDGTSVLTNGKSIRINYVDRVNKQVTFDMPSVAPVIAKGHTFYVQNSKGLEITGLGAIFSNSVTLYGLTRADYKWLSPYMATAQTEIADEVIQGALDHLEEVG